MWVETEPSAQSLSRIMAIAAKKYAKAGIENFYSCLIVFSSENRKYLTRHTMLCILTRCPISQ